MQRHGENALRVARVLEAHPMVAQCHYPGLPSHPDHALARTLYRSGAVSVAAAAAADAQTFGGMIAFVVAGGETGGAAPGSALANARAVCEALRVVGLAVSLGGTESLACHPGSMTHAMVPAAVRRAGGLPDGLVRLSVGLEHVDDIIGDLTQALEVASEAAASDAMFRK
jgi:cystathionine beta-lyase/cystathionine gamma-synthase